MLINVGRFFMLIIWAGLLLNIVKPFPSPANYFLYFALGFMAIMHGLKLLMLKAMVQPGEAKMTGLEQLRVFVFGVFELLAWRKKQNK